MNYQDKDKKKRKVRRLVDVDVSHVSLVDRPANQTPFKFIKRDQSKGNDMHISLRNMFGSRAPEVTSVMADTREKAVAISKMLMTGDSAELSEAEGLFIVRKSGTSMEDEQVVHLGKRLGVAYTVANLQKELAPYAMDRSDFNEVISGDGFIPGMFVGSEALQTAIINIAMAEDTTKDNFASRVRAEVNKFADYIDSLAESLPEKAFKFEKALTAVTPRGAGPVTITPEGFDEEAFNAIFGRPAEDDATTEAAPTESAPVEQAEAAEAAPEAEVTAEAETTAEAPAEAVEAPAETEAEETKMAEKPDNFEELPAGTPESARMSPEEIAQIAVDALTKSLDAKLAEALKPLAERADAADAAVAKLTKAVGGAVATDPEADGDNIVRLSKGAETGGSYGAEGPPLMDTAYNSKRG